MGQIKAHSAAPPICGACEELELGAIIGATTIMDEPITVTEADDMILVMFCSMIGLRTTFRLGDINRLARSKLRASPLPSGLGL